MVFLTYCLTLFIAHEICLFGTGATLFFLFFGICIGMMETLIKMGVLDD